MERIYRNKKKRIDFNDVSNWNKQDIIDYIHKSGCKMLNKLHLEPMTKESIIDYLHKAECPSIKLLFKK